MRHRKVRILHEGQEYWLIDRGGAVDQRSIAFLRRVDPARADTSGAPTSDAPGTGHAPHAPHALVKTDLGDCEALAVWHDGAVTVEPGHERLRDVFTRIVERYLEEFRVGKKRAGSARFYIVTRRRQPLFTLSPAQPGGLMVLVFTSEARAEATAVARRSVDDAKPLGDHRIEEVEDLADFLSARALEGFAGATLDDKDPVFFCLDPDGQPRFLRLSLDARSGRLEHDLLEPDGSWTRYDGEEDLSPDLDQELLDECMIERLGPVPFLGFHDGMTWYHLEKKGRPGVPAVVELGEESPGEGLPFIALFHDVEQAESFTHDQSLEGHSVVGTPDLSAVAAAARTEGRPILLEPGDHRARGGTFWIADGHLLFDSFSGLWRTRDGRAFEPHRD